MSLMLQVSAWRQNEQQNMLFSSSCAPWTILKKFAITHGNWPKLPPRFFNLTAVIDLKMMTNPSISQHRQDLHKERRIHTKNLFSLSIIAKNPAPLYRWNTLTVRNPIIPSPLSVDASLWRVVTMFMVSSFHRTQLVLFTPRCRYIWTIGRYFVKHNTRDDFSTLIQYISCFLIEFKRNSNKFHSFPCQLLSVQTS